MPAIIPAHELPYMAMQRWEGVRGVVVDELGAAGPGVGVKEADTACDYGDLQTHVRFGMGCVGVGDIQDEMARTYFLQQ